MMGMRVVFKFHLWKRKVVLFKCENFVLNNVCLVLIHCH